MVLRWNSLGAVWVSYGMRLNEAGCNGLPYETQGHLQLWPPEKLVNWALSSCLGALLDRSIVLAPVFLTINPLSPIAVVCEAWDY